MSGPELLPNNDADSTFREPTAQADSWEAYFYVEEATAKEKAHYQGGNLSLGPEFGDFAMELRRYNKYKWERVKAVDKPPTEALERTGTTPRQARQGNLCWTECEYKVTKSVHWGYVLFRYYEIWETDIRYKAVLDAITGLPGTVVGVAAGTVPATGATGVVGVSGAGLTGVATGGAIVGAVAAGITLGAYIDKALFPAEKLVTQGWMPDGYGPYDTGRTTMEDGKVLPIWAIKQVRPPRTKWETKVESRYVEWRDCSPRIPCPPPVPPDSGPSIIIPSPAPGSTDSNPPSPPQRSGQQVPSGTPPPKGGTGPVIPPKKPKFPKGKNRLLVLAILVLTLLALGVGTFAFPPSTPNSSTTNTSQQTSSSSSTSTSATTSSVPTTITSQTSTSTTTTSSSSSTEVSPQGFLDCSSESLVFTAPSSQQSCYTFTSFGTLTVQGKYQGSSYTTLASSTARSVVYVYGSGSLEAVLTVDDLTTGKTIASGTNPTNVDVTASGCSAAPALTALAVTNPNLVVSPGDTLQFIIDLTFATSGTGTVCSGGSTPTGFQVG